MKHSFLQLYDLPDELLIIIFKKFDNVLALYSLIGVNRRFDKTIKDPIFTNRLTLLRRSSNDLIQPLANTIVDRFYSRILPEIHYKIEWINLEPSSAKRVLLATKYPNLHRLDLYNIEEETTIRLFKDKKFVFNCFNNENRKMNTNNYITFKFLHILFM